MKVLQLAALAFVALPLVAAAGTPLDTRHRRDAVTMDYLMESCTVVGETAGGMVPHFDCESYLYGILDSHAAVRSGLKPQDRACFPADIAPWQVYKQLLGLERSSDWAKPAAPLIVDALVKRYPCR